MATPIVILIILGCAAYQFQKGTIFKAMTTLIIAVSASIVAFGYFELLADFFISKGSNSKYPSIVPWAQPMCFTLLFILTFAILQTAALQLTKIPVDFGDLPEKIGRPIIGVFLGLFLSGLLLTALAMSPLPSKYPYQRFDARSPSPQKPENVLLNPDGFATGWFSLVSNGSFRAIRNPRSFATIHPAYIDQLFLNRHNDSEEIPLITNTASINVSRKKGEGAWYAPDNLTDAEGKTLMPKSGYRIVVVRLSITRSKDAGTFTTSQIRLISKPSPEEPLAGKGVNSYPFGYFSAKSTITMKKLTDKITVQFGSNTRRTIDFAFEVLSDHIPVLLEFKLNCIAAVPRPVPHEQAPPTVPFDEQVKPPATDPSSPGTPDYRPNYSPTNQNNSGNSQSGASTPVQRLLVSTLDGNQ